MVSVADGEVNGPLYNFLSAYCAPNSLLSGLLSVTLRTGLAHFVELGIYQDPKSRSI